MKNYKPLPDFLTIKQSEIEGLGLFATKDISKDAVLGISHVEIKYGNYGISMAQKIVRTPLGGFYNHSDTPNVYKEKNYEQGVIKYELVALRDIKAGEEITCEYTFYKI